jgi:hypothetical protein
MLANPLRLGDFLVGTSIFLLALESGTNRPLAETICFSSGRLQMPGPLQGISDEMPCDVRCRPSRASYIGRWSLAGLNYLRENIVFDHYRPCDSGN